MNIQHDSAMKVETPSDREIVLTWEFDAPRTLVFDAFVTPEHVRQWWGHRDSILSVCEVDLRPGGIWRFVIRKANGVEEPFRGEYHEIVRPERLVYTFVYDVAPMNQGPPGLVTDLFQETAGRTTLAETMLFPSRGARDGTLQSGMLAGAAVAFHRLEELLARLRAGK